MAKKDKPAEDQKDKTPKDQPKDDGHGVIWDDNAPGGIPIGN